MAQRRDVDGDEHRQKQVREEIKCMQSICVCRNQVHARNWNRYETGTGRKRVPTNKGTNRKSGAHRKWVHENRYKQRGRHRKNSSVHRFRVRAENGYMQRTGTDRNQVGRIGVLTEC